MNLSIRWLVTWVVALFLVAPSLAVVEVPAQPTNPGGGGSPTHCHSTGSGGSPNPAPEPATIVSALVGAAAAGMYAWRRRAKQSD